MSPMQKLRATLAPVPWRRTSSGMGNSLFWLPPVLLSLVVIGADAYSFLVGHVIAELFTVMIAWTFFAMGWKTHALSGNRLLIAMGCGFFWVGSIDLVHIMAYKDMNLLPIGGGNGSTATWISARFLQVAAILLAPILARHNLKVWVQFALFGVIAAGLLFAIFTGRFPATFIEGQGLTPFKVGSEFVIVALSAVAIGVVIALPPQLLEAEDKPLLVYSLVLSILTELTFSFYTDLFGDINLVGHILKIWAFWLIFEAVVQINLVRPHLSLKKLSQVVEQSPSMVVVTDPVGTIEYVNPRFEIDTGYAPAEVLGRNVSLLQSDEMPSQIVDAMWKTITRGDTWQGYFRNVRKDGSLYWDKSTISAIRDERGRIAGYFGIKDDVTQKRQVEEFLLDSENATAKMLTGALDAMVGLLEARDPYTAGHSRNVGAIAHVLADEVGLPKVQMEGLRLAAMVHDIGKIRVPMDILNKPGRLTREEFEIIKQHPQTAYDAIKGIPFPWDVPAIVLAHHEKWDGTGYPNGLAGERIPLEAQILSVADVLDAVSSHRPYRPGLGPDKAFEIVEAGAGTAFSPTVVAAALRAKDRILPLIAH